MIRIIAAVTKHNVIGRDNTIPWNYPGDFRFFKEMTMGSTVIMGLNTWYSLGEKPLPGRNNIVISHGPIVENPKVKTVGNIDQAIDAHCYEFGLMDIWIIGGAQVYTAGLSKAEEIVLTLVPDDIPVEGSVLFPILVSGEWGDATCEKHPYEKDLQVVTYRKIRQ